MAQPQKSCLYFVAGTRATEVETDEIERLGYRYQVKTRTPAGGDPSYSGGLEAADALAGLVPQAYMDAIANYPDGVVTAEEQDSGPIGTTLIVPTGVDPQPLMVGETLQFYCTGAMMDASGEQIVVQDLTGQGEWLSYDEAVATVVAGAVTGVAAGTTNIKWEWEYEPGKFANNSQCRVTVTAIAGTAARRTERK